MSSDTENDSNIKTPLYWDLLSDYDKSCYNKLRLAFNSNSMKRSRGHRLEKFDNILDAIRRYSEHHDENDWRRFLVCGVCWMDNAIAINTRQLRVMISRCKSSINGSLQKLGYITNPSHSKNWNMLFAQIPMLKDNFAEIRQWTIRIKPNQYTWNQQINQQNVIVPTYQYPPSNMNYNIPIQPFDNVNNINMSNANNNNIEPQQKSELTIFEATKGFKKEKSPIERNIKAIPSIHTLCSHLPIEPLPF